MKTKDLKRIIKEYVKEALKEVLAEQFIQNMVREVVSENFLAASRPSSFKEVLKEEPQEERPAEKRASNEERKKKMLKAVVGDESSPYAHIFKDTLESGNSILSEQVDNSDPDRQEVVPESALENAGLMRDYSKFL